jgi:hypothetical protein
MSNKIETETSVLGHELEVNESGGKSSKLNVDWTLLPSVYDLREILKVLTENCDEYGGDYPRNNWKKIDLESHLNHLVDHAMMGMYFAKYDKDSAYDELTHAVCRALFCLYQLRRQEDCNK